MVIVPKLLIDFYCVRVGWVELCQYVIDSKAKIWLPRGNSADRKNGSHRKLVMDFAMYVKT